MYITKTVKTILAAIVIGAVITFSAVIVGKELIRLFNSASGELVDTSVSPERRWKIKVYATEVGAMGSSGGFTIVTDLLGKVPTHRIVLGNVQTQKEPTIDWKDANNVNIRGVKTNVLTGFIYEEKSVSPDRRWKVEVYYVSPVDRRLSGRPKRYYAIGITNLEKAAPPRSIIIYENEINAGDIRWKNNNKINIYGVVIDLSIAGHGAQQWIVADKRTPDVLTFKEILTKSDTWDRAQATLYQLLRVIVFN